VKDLIITIVKALVDEPEKVGVNEIKGEKVLVYEISVADGEVGKIIGKQGITARAMRTIVNATATKLGKHAVLEIME